LVYRKFFLLEALKHLRENKNEFIPLRMFPCILSCCKKKLKHAHTIVIA
jgi:hypothetical protein